LKKAEGLSTVNMARQSHVCSPCSGFIVMHWWSAAAGLICNYFIYLFAKCI